MKPEPAWSCPRCGHSNPDGFYMCSSCELSHELIVDDDEPRADAVWCCRACGKTWENLPSDTECTNCHAPRGEAKLYRNPNLLKVDLSPRMKPCPACKRELSETANRCPHCGHDLNPAGAILKGVALVLVIAVCVYMLCSN